MPPLMRDREKEDYRELKELVCYLLIHSFSKGERHTRVVLTRVRSFLRLHLNQVRGEDLGNKCKADDMFHKWR